MTNKAVSMLGLLFTHPTEFRTLINFYLWHEQKRDITDKQEHSTSGWDRSTMRRCWELLDMTSRSFGAIVKELDGDLARIVCMYYLVLRGLDTIEDDMTIPDESKQPLLRSFHEKTVTPGWKFDGNGPDEKDRQLLVEYDTVVEEINRLAPEYKKVILDICEKMETGMADYAHKAATTGSIYVETVSEYDLYCHYVAGLVGEGLTRIWSASRKEAPWLCDQLELSNSMGLMLQKTNIIRDFREDAEEGRYFWPREIWAKYGFQEMRDLYAPGAEEKAGWIQSAMILDALRHATDSLDYLRLLKNQSIFVFCAVPVCMAMATLSLCFQNPEMFQRNIKIRKAEAARLIMNSTNPREVALIFRDYARAIHHRAKPQDPNFLRLSITCCKIEQWVETNYPSFVVVNPNGTGLDPKDKRSAVALQEKKLVEDAQAAQQAEFRAKRGLEKERLYHSNAPQLSIWVLLGYIGALIGVMVVLGAMLAWVIYKIYEEPVVMDSPIQ
ncbi:squalene synthase [Coniophora puteana RWD-64-598 SS2]|uniref:Squalene synthase n=1 Tax=Coniophora puteana (strain RWD-64-598) TaxID=741705 RepID=A0A5M3M9G0_CONPW|nr:squalene synthase [Coniophora puteana RWD-64-598 SS2]EIW75325.1 squalene synthase [Coniophora puteana RWD-64-598 SS2]